MFILISHLSLIKLPQQLTRQINPQQSFSNLIHPYLPNPTFMEKQPNQPVSNSSQDYRTTFAQEAGISVDQLKDLELQQPKRQRRTRREPIFTDTPIKTHQHTTTKAQLHRSPTIYTSRQQPTLPATPTTPKKQPRSTNQITPKVFRTPQVKILKEPSIPKSVDEFYQNYITFCTRLFKDGDKEITYIETYKKELFELFEATVAQGGIVKLISQGYKNQVFKPFLDRFKKVSTSNDIFSIYKRYLLHFEYQILENYTFKEYHNAVPLFEEAVFVDEQQLRNFLDKTPLNSKYFEYDIMVFRNGQNAIHIDSKTIHLDRVAEHYKDYSIDIRIQKAMDYGFKPRTLRNEPYQMKIGQYRTYQKLCEEYAQTQSKIDSSFIQNLGQVKDLDVNGTPFKERISSEEIFFGVNFDPDDGLLFDEINEKVDGTFLGFKQEFDLLSYLDQQVPGCSFPQFYFKVKGVWTGGHQENINMCSVNINHGPDASEWYSMEFKHVEQFRAQLKKEHKMDLYGSEGLWYEKINWFIEQGKYPVKKIIQKKGDVVVSGPGTLHWVRSHGIALQSAWNQFPITLRMMEYAFCRQEENERIAFVRSNTIPLKMLTLKLLNHQPPQLTPEIQKLCVQKVKMWMKKQEQLFDEFYEESEDFPFEQPRYEKLEDLQGFCTKCRQEILIYFVNGKKVEDILCLNCYKKQYKNKKKTKRLYIRSNLFDLKLLIRKSESGKPFNQLKAFVSQYVGRVPNEQKDYKMDKQSALIQKINDMNQQLNKCDSKKISDFMKKLKSKRNEADEKDEQKQVILDKSQQMDLQQPKSHEKPEQIKISQQKPAKKDLKLPQNIYTDKPTPSGWWNFQVPEKWKIITQQNHVKMLKSIYNQQSYVIKKANRNRWPQVKYPYFVVKSHWYDDEGNLLERLKEERPFKEYRYEQKQDKFDNIKLCDDPKFSSDQDDFTDQIKKKVHKNQDVDQSSLQKDKSKSNQQKSQENQSKLHDKIQNCKIKVRSDSLESKRSKKSNKDKTLKSQRSVSNQKDRKEGKKSRSRSPKSSRRQKSSSRRQKSKHQESRRSSSGSRRSKSRGKSSRRQTNRGDEQRSSRHSGSKRENACDNDGNGDGYKGYNHREYQRDNNQYDRGESHRQDRRNDYGRREESRNNYSSSSRNESWKNNRNEGRDNDNRNQSHRGGYSDSRNNMSSNNNEQFDSNANNYNNNRGNWGNRQQSQRNYNFERTDSNSDRHQGANYRGGSQGQRADYHNPRKYDHNSHNSTSFNANTRYNPIRQDRPKYQHSRQYDNIKNSSGHNQEQSSKIIEEKHENDNFEY